MKVSAPFWKSSPVSSLLLLVCLIFWFSFFFLFLLFSDLYLFYSPLLCLLALFPLVHMRKLSFYLLFFSLLIFHILSVSLEKMSLSYFMFICAF